MRVRDLTGLTASTTFTAGLLLLAPVSGQQPVFRSGATAVRVDVLVEHEGRRVSGLTQADFELLDDGVAQGISLLDVATLPLDVTCVLDTSSSVRGELGDRLVEAATGLVDALHADDRVALLTFASQVQLVSSLTADRPQVRRAIRIIDAEGRTALRDAVFAGLALREDATNRVLLLVFSDGRDTASWLSSANVLEAARAADAVIYTVSVSDLAAWRGSHRRLLEELAAETGGKVIRVGRRDVAPAFRRVLGEFRSRYVLSYEPTGVSPQGWHALTVRLRARPGTVTARRGYFAGDAP